MEREDFKNSVMAMIRNSSEDIEKLIDKAMNCGAIDVENQSPGDYLTRKALLSVIFQTLSDNWAPLTKKGREEVENLKYFI